MSYKYILSLAILLSASILMVDAAESVEYGIIIDKTDGTNAYVKFSEKPVITFGPSDELVISTSGVKLSLPLEDVQGYSFGDVPSNEYSSLTGAAVLNESEIKVNQNEIILRNPGSVVLSIYSISGNQVGHAIVKNDMSVIDISGLSCGVYIIRINNTEAFKFYKK